MFKIITEEEEVEGTVETRLLVSWQLTIKLMGISLFLCMFAIS